MSANVIPYTDQVRLAAVLGRLYRRLKEQGDAVVLGEGNENRRRALEVKFRWQLEGVAITAAEVITDKTAKQHYEKLKVGR
jgi:hypothetical protein